MSETAMSDATMLASLRDIHLPADAVGGLLAEYAAVVGLSALAAVCVVLLLRLLSIQRVSIRAGPGDADSTKLTDLSDDRLRVALLHQLRDRNPQRYSELAADLYRPSGGPSLSALKDEAARDV